MDLLQNSARFRNYVAAFEDSEGFDINDIVKKDFKEMKAISGLDDRQITLLIETINFRNTDHLAPEILRSLLSARFVKVPPRIDEADLRKLFKASDMSLVDENNFADVFEMLFRFNFDQKYLIIKEVSWRCRRKRLTYNIDLVAYDEETGQGNKTLDDLIRNTTCICNPMKCPNDRVALSRFTSDDELKQPFEHHYFCYRGTLEDELVFLILNKEGVKIDAMIELGIVSIEDVIDADITYAFTKDRDYVLNWIKHHPNEKEKIKKLTGATAFNTIIPPDIELYHVLLDAGYIPNDINKASLGEFAEEHPELRSFVDDIINHGAEKEYYFRPAEYVAHMRSQAG
jgi:hypothetical protein